MKLKKWFGQIREFVLQAVGAMPGADGYTETLPARIIRVGHLLFRGYMDDDLTIHASSLTFVTLTSLVPILAVGFALIKGFGMGAEQMDSVMQMDWLMQMPESFQEFVQQVLDIVNNTNFSALGGVGLAFFVLTAVLVLANVEKSFNRVWGVDKSRSIFRQVSSYTSVLVLVPLLIGVVVGLKAQIAIGKIEIIQEYFSIDTNVWAQNLGSFGILWLTIAFLYMFVPNTRVRFRPAFISSLMTTLLFLGWMKMFMVMQTGVSRNGIIYGAFAAVPVFLFWMYVTWVIILLGVEFTFALQNSDTYQLESGADSASMRSRILTALMILRQAGGAMESGTDLFDAASFASKNKAPIRLINSVVSDLVRQRYLTQVAANNGGYVLMRAPESIQIQQLVEGMMREGGGHIGLAETLTMDAPMRETLAKIESGISQGFGGLTLADMVAAAPAEQPS